MPVRGQTPELMTFVHPEVISKVAEPSRLCPEQRRDAAATLGTSRWHCLRSFSATDNFRKHRVEANLLESTRI